jgi:hypothetical protein
MKKVLFLAVLSGLFLGTNAQGIKFGLRGGVSSTQVKMTDVIQVARSNDTILVNFASNTPMGFHGGFFAQVSLGGIFIQPEFLFATTGGEVKVESGDQALYAFSKSAKQRNLRIDVPVLVGMKFGPARLGLGPVASFNLLNKDEVADIVGEVTANSGQSTTAETLFKKAVWGAQIGAGLNILGKIALDVKYEFGLSKLGDGMNVQGREYNFSKRANQAIFSVGYMF